MPELVAEVFWMDQDALSVAVDDDRQSVLLVTNHGIADALFEGLVDASSILDEHAMHVDLRFSFHGLPWRVTTVQMSPS